jgi:putative flippase GtrA
VKKKVAAMLFDHTFARFILVGVVNTLVGSAIMFSLYNITGCGYWLSSAMNYALTSVLSFFLNKRFTFGVKQWSFKMILLFALTIAVSYILAYGIAKSAIHFLLRNQSPRLRDNAALFAGMCLFTGLNYLGQRFAVFRRRQAP